MKGRYLETDYGIRFHMEIQDSKVKGNFTVDFDNTIIKFEGTKDEQNNIILYKTLPNGKPYGRIEGIFDGQGFRGKDYFEGEDEGYSFKLIIEQS